MAASSSGADAAEPSRSDTVQVVVCEAGVVIDKQLGQSLKSYLKQLAIIYFPRVGPPKKCTIYKGSQRQPNGREIIILPRDSIPILWSQGQVIQDYLPPTRQFDATIRTSLDFLYEDQQKIIAHIQHLWTTEPPGSGAIKSYASACLNLRAGYGKTFIAAGIISMMRMRTLYIVPMCELAKQALHDLRASLNRDGNGSGIEIQIKYVTSGTEFLNVAQDPSNNVVCIAVINTIISAETLPFLARYFSLIIFDEVHSYCSSKRINVFWRAQTRYMFGMSATIGDRRDGFDAALAHHLPPLVDAARIEGFSYGENQFRCHVRELRYYARDEYAHNLRHDATDQVFAHYMYEQFARDGERNALIIREARALVAAGHNVFIFAEERAHIELLADLLARGAGPDQPTIPSVIFYGGITDESRQLALCGETHVILATYSYSGTGVSIIRMTAMILATPRYSGMKQIIGRILRRGSDPAIQRVIIDVIDQKTCLSHQFRLRRNAYDFYGATYEKIKIVATEVAPPAPEAPLEAPKAPPEAPLALSQ